MISFLKLVLDATPGKDWITLEISLLPPGLLLISEAPISLIEIGFSLEKIGSAFSSISSKLLPVCSNSIILYIDLDGVSFNS